MSDLSSAPFLSLRGVSLSYRSRARFSSVSRTVVEDLSLDVMKGEIFGLAGLNGAGKTTIIKSVLGLRDCDSGRIEVDGHERSSREAKMKLSYLPERFDPPWFLRGMEFLAFSASLYRAPFDRAAAAESASRLALDPAVLGNRVQTYSKGMRQKLGILATFVTGCPLLILDEPMSGLDPRARASVKALVLEARAQGRTVFFSSHILADMNEICDRVAVLNNGRIVFCGAPGEMKRAGKSEDLEKAFLNMVDEDFPCAA